MGIRRVLAGLGNRPLLLLIVCLAMPMACAKKEEAKKAKPPVPVSVATAVKKDVPVSLHAIGNVEAYSTVAIRSLVAGEVTGVAFREGQDVKKGDLLFTIDRRPLEAEMKRAEAVLSKDTVEAFNADVDAGRYADLYKKGMVSRQQHDQMATAAASLHETVKTDKAAVESIKVQLGYTRINAPIEGRTGNLNVNKGNIIKANDVPLVVINQIKPIYVTFAVPEKRLPEVQGLMSRARPRVCAKGSGETCVPEEGALTFIDNAVDVATATIKMKATFPNSDRKLWPGQSVDVELSLSTLAGATVVPAQAVLTGQKGEYVFVVKQDHTVEVRPVTVGMTQGTEAVLDSGVKPGEVVVTDGQVRLVPGAAVEIKSSL